MCFFVTIENRHGACEFQPKSVIRGICFVVVNVIYRLTGSCKLKFLMTAIRSLNFQYAWFQHVTRNTTKMGFSNDRFGLIVGVYLLLSRLPTSHTTVPAFTAQVCD